MTMSGSGEEATKAELYTGIEPVYPYFSIFWKNGEFSHIRLYLNKNLSHESYGDLENPEDFADKFNVETLALEF